jgi:putative DNA primase/helicase
VVDMEPLAKFDRMNAEDAGDAAAGDTAADPRQAEIARLADLATVDYQAARKDAAAEMGLKLAALDKAVRAERARRRAAVAQAHRRKPPPAPGEVRWPPGFTMKDDGLYGPPGEDAPPSWICAPFEVLGHTRDHAGEAWGLWLRWRDRDGTAHTYAMPAELLMVQPGQLEAELVRRGLRIAADGTARALLRLALGAVETGSRVRVAYATGWQGSDAAPAFLLPDGAVLGAAAEPVVLHNPPADAAQRCATLGTLDGWKSEVAALAVGNPLAGFCISAAFAGPLLLPAGDAGGGFHLFGQSKRGKTLALQMGLSAWGLPYKAGGALRDWRSTANALEAAAEECADGLLTLDELHQANPADVAGACYMLADGGGKTRLKRDASAARRRNWRIFILSTGEPDVASVVARAGQRLPAGAEVRLPSVPVDDAATTWTALHGRLDFATFAKDVHQALRQHHGTGARAFLAHLAAERAGNPAALATFIDALRGRIADRLPAAADAQVRDAARRFALVAAAGELAAAWGVLPWHLGEAEAAAVTMLRAWLARRPGGSGAAEAAAQIERVRAALVQHGPGRFTAMHHDSQHGWQETSPERPVQNRIGWRKRDHGRDEFLIPPETWRSDVCAPAALDPVATARTLAEGGFLRRDGKNLTVKERLPGFANPVRVYAVSAALVEAGEDDARVAA